MMRHQYGMDDVERAVYLDYAATTPLDPEVLDEMMPYLRADFGNASSQHAWGRRARQGVDAARQRVANLIGGEPDEIVFTSGATESINLALKGFMRTSVPSAGRLITVATEHKAVLDVTRALERCGHRTTVAPTDSNGVVRAGALQDALIDGAAMVSIMAANNETGVLGPVQQVAEMAHASGAVVHSDATQLVGKLPVDVARLGVDLMSFSSHKLYGPKGVGALYVRHGLRRRLDPQLHGGGHERGLRSGTLNVPGIVGFGKASEIATQKLGEEPARIDMLRHLLERLLLGAVPNAVINGARASRLPNIVNIRFPGRDADSVVLALRDVAVSSGSACTAASPSPSHVLQAMGVGYDDASESLRISLGRFSTEDEVRFAVDRIVSALALVGTSDRDFDRAGVAR